MLNPDLKLNPKIFDNDVEKKATRDGFGEALFKLGKSNEKVVVLSADLSGTFRHELLDQLSQFLEKAWRQQLAWALSE